MPHTIVLDDATYNALAAIFAPASGVVSTVPTTTVPPAVPPATQPDPTTVGMDAHSMRLPSGATGSMRTGAVTPAAPAAPVTGYAVGKVTLEDAMYLTKMDATYRSLVPHSQLFFDILVRNDGKRWSDGVPQPAGTVNDPTLKTDINRLINLAGEDNAALTAAYNPANYTGPLKAILTYLIAARIAGHW